MAPTDEEDAMAVTTAETDLEQLTRALRGDELTAWDYGTATGVLVGGLIIGRVAQSLVKRLLAKSPADSFLGDLIGRIVNYVIVAFGLIYSLETLGVTIGPILGALGIVGIALAFAFQDILENFVAGIIIQIQRPFTSGDEIVTADHQGTIVAVDARTITIRTPDGEIVHIPSAEVIKNPIVNLTQHGSRRTTVDVGVAYGTDLDRAADVAERATRQVEDVLASPPPEVLVRGFGTSSIDLAVRFWHQPSIASRWQTRDRVVRAVARSFTDNGITIPFPQRVLHIERDGEATERHGDPSDPLD
jgi:small-conductance mechanosensitive channel